MFTAMLAVMSLVAACMLSCLPAIAFSNEAAYPMRSVGVLVFYAFLIVLAVGIGVIPVYLVSEMTPPADGNYLVINWCRWGVGIPLALSGLYTAIFLIDGGSALLKRD